MTRRSPSTNFPKPPDFAAQARRFAEIAAEISAGILPGDYSEGGISAFAAKVEEIFCKTWLAESDRRSEQPPAVVERKPRGPSISAPGPASPCPTAPSLISASPSLPRRRIRGRSTISR